LYRSLNVMRDYHVLATAACDGSLKQERTSRGKLKREKGKGEMKLKRWKAVWVVIAATALASGAFQGTAPRSTADKYGAHGEQNGVAIGAVMLTSGEVHKTFKTDVDRCCQVVEVALYPQNGSVTQVSLRDFTLQIVGQEIGAKPSTPKVVAWRSSHDSDRLRPTLILAMEQELGERALPLGNATAPVSGYLYFEFSTKAKKAKYQLEYMAKGGKMVLALN
jgi:hypothetical protein